MVTEPIHSQSPVDKGHRTTLPAPAIDTSDVSLWSLLRKNIGELVLVRAVCPFIHTGSHSLSHVQTHSLHRTLLVFDCRKGFVEGFHAGLLE